VTYELHHGDALAVLRDLPTGSVDAVITDPPYSSGGRRENARSVRKSMIRSMDDDEWIAGDSMSTAGFVWTMRTLGFEARRVLKPGGHLLAFIDWRMYPNLALALEAADLRQHPTLVWDKTQIGMGAIFRNQHEWICHFTAGSPAPPQRRDVGNVLRCQPVREGEHPTQKPTALMRTLVSVVCPRGGIVLDPFMGSGATGVGALLEGCNFVGVSLGNRRAWLRRRR
jgi:DNA modification methylase